MRKSFGGLYALTKNELHQDPLSGRLFVVINRRGTQSRRAQAHGVRFTYPVVVQKGVREHFRLNCFASWGASSEKFSDPFLRGWPTVLGWRYRHRRVMRRPRLEMPGIPLHITHRGVNRGATFIDDEDRQKGVRATSPRF